MCQVFQGGNLVLSILWVFLSEHSGQMSFRVLFIAPYVWPHSRFIIYFSSPATTCWRHQMETFFALLAICAGNSPVPCEFPAQRPVTWSFDVFFDLRLNKMLSKQSWDWWFETLSRPLWRHCNVVVCSISQKICRVFFISFRCGCLITSWLTQGPLLLTWIILNPSMDK